MAKYSTDEKLEAVLEYLEGHKSFKTIAEEREMSLAPLKRWVMRYREHGVEGSVEALQAEVERLRMGNAYLKKLNTLVQSKEKITKQDKAQVVFELRTEFPVSALLPCCEFLLLASR